MKAFGLRHVALNVSDTKRSQAFYCGLLGMSVEWEPDPQNLYLTTDSQDNLALHVKPGLKIDPDNQALDHIGFFFDSEAAVDATYEKAVAQNIVIVAKPKKHRDGAYSFYMRDPDGYVVQILCHPPILAREKSSK